MMSFFPQKYSLFLVKLHQVTRLNYMLILQHCVNLVFSIQPKNNERNSKTRKMLILNVSVHYIQSVKHNKRSSFLHWLVHLKIIAISLIPLKMQGMITYYSKTCYPKCLWKSAILENKISDYSRFL